MNNIYCACTTPDVYGAYATHWKNFPKDKKLVWLSDISKDPSFDLGFTYTEKELIERLKFKGSVSNKHYWNSSGNRNIIWFYAHLRMLNFYLDYPDYDYYWFFDDDVTVKDWNILFEGTDSNTADFIGYIVFKDHGIISQPHVPVIDNNTTSKHMWFERFPGVGDVLPDGINEKFGSFFPTNRFSNEAMAELLRLNSLGFYGYSEGFVPTVLNKNGFGLRTLINSDNSSDFFNPDVVDIKHKHIKINWEWI